MFNPEHIERSGGGPTAQMENCGQIPTPHYAAVRVMNVRRHSLLARNLIRACGGLEEAARATRLGKSQLSNAQNPNLESVLPIDVIVDLESYCGDPLYSRAAVEACRIVSGSGDVVGEAIDVNAQVASLSSHVHHAVIDGIITPNEENEIQSIIENIQQSLARIQTDIENKRGGKS